MVARDAKCAENEDDRQRAFDDRRAVFHHEHHAQWCGLGGSAGEFLEVDRDGVGGDSTLSRVLGAESQRHCALGVEADEVCTVADLAPGELYVFLATTYNEVPAAVEWALFVGAIRVRYCCADVGAYHDGKSGRVASLATEFVSGDSVGHDWDSIFGQCECDVDVKWGDVVEVVLAALHWRQYAGRVVRGWRGRVR